MIDLIGVSSDILKPHQLVTSLWIAAIAGGASILYFVSQNVNDGMYDAMNDKE